MTTIQDIIEKAEIVQEKMDGVGATDEQKQAISDVVSLGKEALAEST